MQEVKKKPLASSEPQAFGRNALLQKRLESRCHRLHREHRTLQKQLDAASEKCITSIYSLLLEAEENEKEEKAKQKDKDVKSCIIGTIKGVAGGSKVTASKHHVRPQTAHPAKAKDKQRKDSDVKRPKSAHASLFKRQAVTDDDSEDKNKGEDVAKSGMNRRISMATLRNLDKRDSTDDKAVLRPWQKIKKAVFSQAKEDSKDKETNEDDKGRYDQTYSCSSAKKNTTFFGMSCGEDNRPKTADYYRKKHPDDPRSEYWNDRVHILIRKWNMQDRGESYLDRRNISAIANVSKPPPHIMHDPNMGQAEIKVKSFLRKYATKYRTLLVASSAPPQESRHRKSEKITRQELASIHADVAKRKHNTRMILRKSKRLKSFVEQLTSGLFDDE